MVEARFVCELAKESLDRQTLSVRLRAATRYENPEFWRATPNGIIEMEIKNPAAFAFVEGREYRITFDETGGEVR